MPTIPHPPTVAPFEPPSATATGESVQAAPTEPERPAHQGAQASSKSNPTPLGSELQILRDFCLLREIGIDPALYTVHAGPETRPCLCWSYETVDPDTGRPYDVIRLDFRHYPEDASRRLVPRSPHDYQEALWRFKREYCRRHHLQCDVFDSEEAWEYENLV